MNGESFFKQTCNGNAKVLEETKGNLEKNNILKVLILIVILINPIQVQNFI